MIRFLFDEDVTPRLRDVANQIRLFGAALDFIEAAEPQLDMVNCVAVE